MATRTVTMNVCDKCHAEIGLAARRGVQVKGSLVRLDMGGGATVLVEGEYCVDCAAHALGHSCPEVDPPIRSLPWYQ